MVQEPLTMNTTRQPPQMTSEQLLEHIQQHPRDNTGGVCNPDAFVPFGRQDLISSLEHQHEEQTQFTAVDTLQQVMSAQSCETERRRSSQAASIMETEVTKKFKSADGNI